MKTGSGGEEAEKTALAKKRKAARVQRVIDLAYGRIIIGFEYYLAKHYKLQRGLIEGLLCELEKIPNKSKQLEHKVKIVRQYIEAISLPDPIKKAIEMTVAKWSILDFYNGKSKKGKSK